MPGRFVRFAPVLAAPFAAALAVAGGLALQGSAVFALSVVTAAVGGAAAGATWADPLTRGAARVVGLRAAAWTAGGLLVLCGAAVLVGTAVTVLAGGVLAAVSVLLRRPVRRAAKRTATPPLAEPEGPIVLSPLHPVAPVFWPLPSRGPRTVLLPVRDLTSGALGEEWLRSTALLDSSTEPEIRHGAAIRRELVLDELERRDPAGFARWLADGAPRGSDPADYVHGGPPSGGGDA